MSKTIRIDSHIPFSSQNLIDELQNEVDANKVEDVIIIIRNKEDIRMMTTPIEQTEVIGLLDMAKMHTFFNE